MVRLGFILIFLIIVSLFANEKKYIFDEMQVFDSKIEANILKNITYSDSVNNDFYYFNDDDKIEKINLKSKKKSKYKKFKCKKNIKKRIVKRDKKIKKILRKKKKRKENLVKIKRKYSKLSKKVDNKVGLTLKSAILKAISRNKKILSLREKVIQAKRVVDQKRASLFPVININGTSSKNINSEEGKEIADNFYKDEAQLSITQNLYAGGKTLNDIKDAKAKLETAVAKYQQNLEKEILNVIQAYLSVIYEKKSIKTNRENIVTLNKILDIVTLKEKSGAATKGDLNYIRSNIENTKSELVLAESKYKNAISYYEYFVGDIKDDNYPIEENVKVSINPNANIEKLIFKNPKLLEIEAKIKALKYSLESKKSRFKPTVDLILTRKHKSSTLNDDPSQDKKSAAISFNYTIFNGGSDKAKLFEIKSKINEQRYKYFDLKKSLTFNAIEILNNMNSTKKSLEHIKKQLDANQKVVDSYWNAFKYGNQDLQALLLAQNALNRSKLDKLESQKSYITQYFQLLSSVGAMLRYFGIEYLVDVNIINQHEQLSIFRSNFHD